MNPLLLKNELDKDEYTGKSAAECAALLNAQTIEQKRQVEKTDTLNYLRKSGIRSRLKDAAANTIYPKVLRDRIDDFLLTVTSYEKTDYRNFEADTAKLVFAGILTQPEVDAFMSLAVVRISRAQKILGEFADPVSEADVQATRNLPKIAEVRALQEKAASAYGALLELLQGAESALYEGQTIEAPTQDEALDRFCDTMETP